MPRNPERLTPHPLFELGQLVATPAALDALATSGEEPLPYIHRHVCGDWIEMDPNDQRANALAVKEGHRILSAYTLLPLTLRNGRKIWLITEWDRSVTTLLLPEDY
jgi:hypothetical protein